MSHETIPLRRRLSDIALDRAWPFPLHDPAALLTLRSDIDALFDATTTERPAICCSAGAQ